MKNILAFIALIFAFLGVLAFLIGWIIIGIWSLL